MDETFLERSAALAGIFTALFGTLLAIILIPEDPFAKGAMTWPALVLAGGILFVPAMRALKRSQDTLNAENFVAVGFVYWILLDPIQGAYDLDDVSHDGIKYAMVAIGISAAAMWVGVLSRPWRLLQRVVDALARPLETETLVKIIPLCFLIGMANYIYSVNFDFVEMFSYLGGSRWETPWGRGQLGGWDAFLDHTQYFGYALPSLAVLLGVRRGWLKKESLLAIAAAVIMLLFLGQGGGRRIIGVTVGAAIIVWTLAQPGLKLQRVFVAAMGIIGLLWIMEFMLGIRSEGYEEYSASGRQFEYLHVDDNFLRLAQIIDIIPNEHPFVGFKQIFFVMVRPIPRIFWEGKPIDPGFDLPATVGLQGVSLSTSIIGEWYLCFGWIAVIFGGWLHGRLAVTANSLREGRVVESNPIAYALAVMVLVAGLRSMQDLVIMSYTLLALYAAISLATRRKLS